MVTDLCVTIAPEKQNIAYVLPGLVCLRQRVSLGPTDVLSKEAEKMSTILAARLTTAFGLKFHQSLIKKQKKKNPENMFVVMNPHAKYHYIFLSCTEVKSDQTCVCVTPDVCTLTVFFNLWTNDQYN